MTSNKAVVELPEEIDKVVSELAKATGKPKDEVVAELLKKVIEEAEKETDKDEEPFEYFKKIEQTFMPRSTTWQDIKEILALKMLQGDSDTEKYLLKVMSKMMLWSFYTKMLEYVMQSFNAKKEEDKYEKLIKMLARALTKAKSKEEKDKIVELLEKLIEKEEKKERGRMMELIESLKKELSELKKKEEDKKYEELRKEIENLYYVVEQRLAQLEQAKAYAPKDEISSLEEAINKLQRAKKLLKQIKDIVEEKPVVTDKGINWDKLISEVKDIIISFAPKPQPQQIQYYYPEQQNVPLSNTNEAELQKDREVLKPVSETKEESPNVEETQKEETQTVETHEENKATVINVSETKNEETPKAESSSSFSENSNAQKVPDAWVLTTEDIKRIYNADNVYIDEQGQVHVVKGDTDIILSKEQIKQLDNMLFEEKVKKGEIAYELDYSADEIIKDEKLLKGAYIYATAGFRVKDKDGKDITDIVLQEGKKRGLKSFYEMVSSITNNVQASVGTGNRETDTSSSPQTNA